MRLNTSVRCRRGLLVLVGGIALLVAGPVRAQEEPGTSAPNEGRFGVIESFEDPAAAARLGAGWTRVRFQWAEVQGDGPDSFTPPLSDEDLAAELDADRQVVGLIIGVPDWARDRRGLPRGLHLPPDHPDNTWATFVRSLAGRYAGRIDHWIIWNEPDIDDPDAPGHTWDGTMEEFLQLHRAAYLVTKATNPDAVVHLSAFTYFWDPTYFGRFLDLILADPGAAENNHYFDVATAHLYFQPNAIHNVLYAFEATMAQRGLDKPLWLVETNAPPTDDPYWTVPNWTLEVTLNEQAAFIPQALASALAAGAERIAVYKLKDTEGDRAANPEPFGLMRWDNSRRPAFDTYRVAIGLLEGVTGAERERWDEVGQIRLDQGGGTTTVLFARLPGSQEARVRAFADEAELVDMWGRRETLSAENGYFELELPGALCSQTIADYCMIGGTTYYLIQTPDEDAFIDAATIAPDTPTARAVTLPTTTPGAAFTARPAPSATPSAMPTRPPAVTASATPAATYMVEEEDTIPPSAAPPAKPDSRTTDMAGLRRSAGLVAISMALLVAVGLAIWWLAGGRR